MIKRWRLWMPDARRYLPGARLPRVQRRPRLLTAALALATGAGLAIGPIASGGAPAGLQWGAAGLGEAALICGLLGWVPGIAWAVVFLAADYGAALVGRSVADPAVPLEAAGLLLLAELAAWSLECRSLAADTPAVLRWRLRRLVLLESVALISGAAVLAAADLPAQGGTTLGAIGVASAVAVLLVAAVLLRRLRRGVPS